MSTNHYLQHLQNTSPAKTTYSFSKGSRFPRFNSYLCSTIDCVGVHLINFMIFLKYDQEDLHRLDLGIRLS